MRIWHFAVILSLMIAGSACDQLADQRARAQPPALPPVILEPEPVVHLTASKMNVAYVGIDNPLDLRYNGTDFNDLVLIASPPGYISQYEKNYVLKVAATGRQEVKVLHQGKLLNEFTFRTKILPDPTASLGLASSGTMSVGEFKAQRGLVSMIPNFDFEVRCVIKGFRIERISAAAERSRETNSGAKFSGATQQLINQATPGDLFIFTEIKAQCPGDKASRLINPMVFDII